MSDVIYAYLAKHPRVSVDLELRERPGDLLTDGFDIQIVAGKIDTTDFVARELWKATRKLLYASPADLQRGAPKKVEDLARHDCIATVAADGRATWTFVRGRRKRRITFEPSTAPATR